MADGLVGLGLFQLSNLCDVPLSILLFQFFEASQFGFALRELLLSPREFLDQFASGLEERLIFRLELHVVSTRRKQSVNGDFTGAILRRLPSQLDPLPVQFITLLIDSTNRLAGLTDFGARLISLSTAEPEQCFKSELKFH